MCTFIIAAVSSSHLLLCLQYSSSSRARHQMEMSRNCVAPKLSLYYYHIFGNQCDHIVFTQFNQHFYIYYQTHRDWRHYCFTQLVLLLVLRMLLQTPHDNDAIHNKISIRLSNTLLNQQTSSARSFCLLFCLRVITCLGFNSGAFGSTALRLMSVPVRLISEWVSQSIKFF